MKLKCDLELPHSKITSRAGVLCRKLTGIGTAGQRRPLLYCGGGYLKNQTYTVEESVEEDETTPKKVLVRVDLIWFIFR